SRCRRQRGFEANVRRRAALSSEKSPAVATYSRLVTNCFPISSLGNSGRELCRCYRDISRAVQLLNVIRQEAAGTGLVLRHDRGLSRNMLAEMAGEQPPEGVIAAARRVADDEIDGLAGVELFRRLRRSLDTQA